MLTLYDFILLLGIVGLLWLKWGCGWQGGVGQWMLWFSLTGREIRDGRLPGKCL